MAYGGVLWWPLNGSAHCAFVLALRLSCCFFTSLKVVGFANYRVMDSLLGEMAISRGVNNNSMSGALIAFGPLYLMLKAGPYAYSEEDEPCEALWHPWKYVYSPLDSGHRKVWTLG